MEKKVTIKEVMEIGTKVDNSIKQFGDFFVKRISITDFEVIKDGIIVFEGEDEEVVDFINGD